MNMEVVDGRCKRGGVSEEMVEEYDRGVGKKKPCYVGPR